MVLESACLECRPLVQLQGPPAGWDSQGANATSACCRVKTLMHNPDVESGFDN